MNLGREFSIYNVALAHLIAFKFAKRDMLCTLEPAFDQITLKITFP